MKLKVVEGGDPGKKIYRILDKRIKLVRENLEPALEEVKDDLIARTQSGKDVNDGKFKPYSKSWAAVRTAAGLQTTNPDLTFTGAMLGSLKVKVYRNMGQIFFGDRREARKASENQRLRQFFGWSQRAVRLLVAKLRETKQR